MKSTILYILSFIFISVIQINVSDTYAYSKKTNIINYHKKDYKAGRQNWDVKIDKYGIIYFGNSQGLLYNNCGNWGLAQMNNQEVVRSIFIENDTIWAGGNEYGYFTHIEDGFQFTSLGKFDYQQVWNIEAFENTIVFQTEDKIALFDKITQKTTFLTHYEGINACIKWNNKIWVLFRSGRTGIIENGKITFQKTFSSLLNQQVRKLFIHNKDLYIPLYNGKLFKYDGLNLTEVALDKTLENDALFTGISYEDQKISLGSVANGLIIIDETQNTSEKVDQLNGLMDNTVLSMAKDSLGNIWLGLDYGIAKVELQSNISHEFKGAATYSFLDYKNSLLIGTNKGLFQSDQKGKYSLQKEISGQVWNIKEINHELFVCHNSGLSILKENGIEEVIVHTGTVDIAAFEGTPFYLISTYDGLMLYAKKDGQFWYVNSPGIYGYVQLHYDKENNCIWGEINNEELVLCTLENGAIVKTERAKNIMNIYNINDELYFWGPNKFLKYKEGKFVSLNHPLLNPISNKDIPALAMNASENILGYVYDNKIHLIELLSDGNIHTYNAQLKSLQNDINKDFEFIDFKDNLFRIATDRGLTTFDVKYQSKFKKDSQPMIGSIEITNQNQKLIYPYSDQIVFNQGEKDIQFNFFIDKLSTDIAEFRYKITPLESEWSEWSADNTSLTRQNLKGGKYTLQLQSKVNEGRIKTTTLVFEIEKYWYETYLVLLPILLIFGFSIYISVIVSRYFHFKKVNIHKSNLQRQNAQEIISLKEEQLLKYMEIINLKDNFLMKVQGGLNRMRTKEAMKWSGLIEEEINREKKDLLFHQLFTDLHQDFIRSITEKHPNLTTNDIRIISFIRLNLSSKEIANLMNINTRSLDTSRYRLRKKLDLNQGEDLYKFILEFK